MITALRHFALGIALIAIASGILLVSDWQQRRTATSLKRIAIVQHASQPALDDVVNGMIDALAAAGFVDGKNIAIKRFNPEADMGTANAIANQVANGDYDLILTSSTVSLQTVANANRAGKTTHIFGGVADPFSAGVGVKRENPLDHPKHLTGYGTRISADRAIQQARDFNPQLKKLGLIWNAAETNSLRYTLDTREACKKFGIELLEANAENSTAVSDAANSVVARGAEAIILTGDVMVLVAAETVVNAGRRDRVPVFSIIPPTVTRGALFDLGANFYEVGKQTGELAAEVLNGGDPAKIPVREAAPERLGVNLTALANLRDNWKISPATVEKASMVVDASGVHDKKPPPTSAPPGTK